MAAPPKMSKRKQSLLADLFSAKAETVLGALEKVPAQGDASFVVPVLKAYRAWPADEAIREKATFILFHMKSQEVIPELLKALEEPELQDDKAFVISVFWNAGLIPTELDVLVKHAIRGDYMVAFEALTVIEQMEDSADADLAQEAVFDLDEYVDEHPDAPHVEILGQLRQVLVDFYNL